MTRGMRMRSKWEGEGEVEEAEEKEETSQSCDFAPKSFRCLPNGLSCGAMHCSVTKNNCSPLSLVWRVPYALDCPTDALRAIFEANFFGWHDLTIRVIKVGHARGLLRITSAPTARSP
jgi:hypothetical protein